MYIANRIIPHQFYHKKKNQISHKKQYAVESNKAIIFAYKTLPFLEWRIYLENNWKKYDKRRRKN